MTTIASKILTWLKHNITRIAALITLALTFGGYIREHPIIAQIGVICFVFLVSYEIGYRRGTGSLEDISENIFNKHNTTEHSNPLVKSDKEIMEENIKEIQEWFTINESGEILLHPKGDVNLRKQILLHLIAAKTASEIAGRENATVSREQISEKIDSSEYDEHDIEVAIRRLPSGVKSYRNNPLSHVSSRVPGSGRTEMSLRRIKEMMDEDEIRKFEADQDLYELDLSGFLEAIDYILDKD
jgi:hypothetical protein